MLKIKVTFVLYYICTHRGTPFIQTPLRLTQSVLIRGISLFQRLFYMHEIHLGLHAVSILKWMSVFQGYLQGGWFHCVCYRKLRATVSKNNVKLSCSEHLRIVYIVHNSLVLNVVKK